MRRFLMFLLCLTFTLTFVIGCGGQKQTEEKVEETVEEVTEEAAVDTAAVDTMTPPPPAPEE